MVIEQIVLLGLWIPFLAYQLKTGRGYGRGRGIRPFVYTREQDPGSYWSLMAVNVGAIALIALMDWKGKPEEQAPETIVAEAAKAPSPRDKAYELLKTDQPAQALPVFEELLLEAPNSADLLYGRSRAYWKLGKTEQALAGFRRVIELQPDHYDATVSVDRILEPQARWPEILEMWNRFMTVNQSDPFAYVERAGTHERMGNRAGAVADLTKACELGKKDACPVAERLRAGLRH